MQTDVLLPEIESMQDGEGPAVDAAPGCCQRVTLGITQTLEHEKLDVAIWGSPDGEDWGERPLAEFPSKSYCGVYSLLLDLGTNPGIRHLRASWRMRAWAAGQPPYEARDPLFSFYLNVEALPGRPPGAVTQKARAAAA